MGLSFPLKEQYETMRAYLNKEKEYEYLRKEYEELRKEYEDLRKEYEDLRYTFNLQEGYTDVWQIDFYRQEVEHEVRKPIALMSRIIKTATKEGGLVLDPFMGSGSTGIACKKTNREFIGFELNKKCFEEAQKRITETIKQKELGRLA